MLDSDKSEDEDAREEEDEADWEWRALNCWRSMKLILQHSAI